MVKIIVKVEKLSRFLDYITCKGQTAEGQTDYVVKEMVLSATNNQLSGMGMDDATMLFASAITDVQVIETGKFFIADVKTLYNHLGIFRGDDEVAFSQEGGWIKILRNSPKKLSRMSSIDLSDSRTINGAQTIDGMYRLDMKKKMVASNVRNLPVMVVANAEDIVTIVKDSSAVNEKVYPFTIIKNENGEWTLKIEVGNPRSSIVKSEIPTTEIHTDVELNNSYSFGFDNVFGVLKGKVHLFTAPGDPMFIYQLEGDIKSRYMLSPYG